MNTISPAAEDLIRRSERYNRVGRYDGDVMIATAARHYGCHIVPDNEPGGDYSGGPYFFGFDLRRAAETLAANGATWADVIRLNA